MPRHTCIGPVTIAGLPEIGSIGIKLPPTDRDLITIRRINGNRGLVCSVADDVIPLRVYVRLIADEWAVLRDHSRRGLEPVNQRGRLHLVSFERLREAPRRRRLARSRGER